MALRTTADPPDPAPMQTRTAIAHALLALLLSAADPAAGQLTDLRLPISLDADATDYDGKSSMLMFRGLRLTQGNMGVEADFGRASQLDFEDSVWQFTGNVRIDTGDGLISCESADLRFAGHQLRHATITGSPATFELRRPGNEDMTYAEAGRLEYDFTAGIVEFEGNATITEGGNRISGNYLVYNIEEQRINAESGDGEKVKIIYTPGTNSTDPGAEPDDGETADEGSEDPETGPDNGAGAT